jgi:hypothetical protein
MCHHKSFLIISHFLSNDANLVGLLVEENDGLPDFIEHEKVLIAHFAVDAICSSFLF